MQIYFKTRTEARQFAGNSVARQCVDNGSDKPAGKRWGVALLTVPPVARQS